MDSLTHSIATTVQVSDETKRMLNNIHEQTHRTYDEIIRELIRESKHIPRTLFGAHPDIPDWKNENRARMKHE